MPEAYRHSVGILDTAGNLIMHLGQYGNYLVVFDWSDRLVVLKLDYRNIDSAGTDLPDEVQVGFGFIF